MAIYIIELVALAVCATATVELDILTLPDGPVAPVVIPTKPKPFWSWDRIPTSFHGAVKSRHFNQSEIHRLAKYHMVTPEKWYTPCASQGPVQGTPACAVEAKTENLFHQIRAQNPNVTTVLYWNSMFDFAFYSAHQQMLDLERQGIHAFLRDETGEVISLCNDGNVYCNITTFDFTQAPVRAIWIGTVINASKVLDKQGKPLVDGIFADHSGTWGNGVNIGTGKNGQLPNQLCNGKGAGRLCYNFTASFRKSFNSWHDWVVNYTQDILAKSTGGPVIQGPYARMGAASACDFDSIRFEQAKGFNNSEGVSLHLTVNEAKDRHSCAPSTSCIAAYLAAAEPYTYMHCQYNGEDLLGVSVFPEMDYPLGEPDGPAQEVRAGIWRRRFRTTPDGDATEVMWNSQKQTGKVTWAHERYMAI